MLAGVSVDYYTRLERGNASGVSETVLDALARALQLDERRARAPVRPRPRRSVRPRAAAPVGVAARAAQRAADARRDDDAPAFVRNGRMDILAANRLGRALYSELFASPRRPPNTARFVFLDPRAPGFYADWQRVANDAVAILRSRSGPQPV